MGIISVRVDDGTEARLKREARAQGRKFSDFLRERLGGEAADFPDPGLERRMENMEKELRQLADDVWQAGRNQDYGSIFIQMLILQSLCALDPDLKEAAIREVYAHAKAKADKYWKRNEGNPS